MTNELPEHGGYQTDLLELLNALLRRRLLVLGLPLLAGLFTIAVALLIEPAYTASTTFAPEVRSQTRLPAGLASLAGQFGVSLPSEPSQPPRFYGEVVKSRELMERILLTRYPGAHRKDSRSDSTTLLATLHLRGRDSADVLYKGVKRLRKLVTVTVDLPTNIVTVRVELSDPAFAAEVANRVVTYLNDFNARTRQSSARERRKFVEARIVDGERDLRQAEDDLKRFYQSNRSWQQSPQLVFEEGRLRRQLEIRQELYLTLKREYETARIEEVNDTPVITVIDSAVVPMERSRPKRTMLALLGVVVGGIAGVVTALAAQYLDRARQENGKQYREFTDHLARLRGQLGLGWRVLARRNVEHRD